MTSKPDIVERLKTLKNRAVDGATVKALADAIAEIEGHEIFHDEISEMVKKLRSEIERLEADRDAWQKMVGEIVSTIPLKDTLKASGTLGDTIDYLKSSFEELERLEADALSQSKMISQLNENLNSQDHDIKMLQAENERLRGQGWQPIETAPKDETRFLAYEKTDIYSPSMFECWWDDRWEDMEGAWHDDWDTAPTPTHWRPLLQPPKEE